MAEQAEGRRVDHRIHAVPVVKCSGEVGIPLRQRLQLAEAMTEPHRALREVGDLVSGFRCAAPE
jgi:hypothetical protein